MKHQFVFGEITSSQYLNSLFRLRFQVYRETGLTFHHKSPLQTDLDHWDLYSQHYGLILSNSNCDSEQLIGGRRIIGSNRTFVAPTIESFFKYHLDFAGIDPTSPPFENFPMMTYANHSWMISLLQSK